MIDLCRVIGDSVQLTVEVSSDVRIVYRILQGFGLLVGGKKQCLFKNIFRSACALFLICAVDTCDG